LNAFSSVEVDLLMGSLIFRERAGV
jgi:hypothetical protein